MVGHALRYQEELLYIIIGVILMRKKTLEHPQNSYRVKIKNDERVIILKLKEPKEKATRFGSIDSIDKNGELQWYID
jgi:hypothetical protein